MSDHYILPGELVALMIFVFAPPLLLALVGQVLFLRRRLSLAGVAFAITCVTSILIGFGLLSVGLPRWLGVHDVLFAGHYWPVMPLAFVVVGVVSLLVTVGAGRRLSV